MKCYNFFTGDDIGRGQPTDTSSGIDHQKTLRSIIWGVAASFILIFIIILVSILLVCQYYRLVYIGDFSTGYNAKS